MPQVLKLLLATRSWLSDPNLSWQKCAIENIEKHIQSYFLGNTDLAKVSQAHLTALANNLKATPRKCPGFIDTPRQTEVLLIYHQGD